VNFNRGEQRFRYDLNSREMTNITDNSSDRVATTRPQRSQRPQVARGRQRTRVTSPDGKWVALCKDWNVVIEPVPATNEDGEPPKEESASAPASAPDSDVLVESDPPELIRVTTDGTRKFRYGSASWVYGEELDQREAMWWTPDSSKLVFYEFDERQVPDHYIADDLTKLHTKLLTEGYPKPGEPNPIANLLIYDLGTQATVRVQSADDPEWYTYGVQVTKRGEEPLLIFHRTNRRQDTLQLCTADLQTGAVRIVLTESQPAWQENLPEFRFLEDGHRFIWATEKTGWKHYELRDLDGGLHCTLTRGEYPAGSIVRVDEKAGVMYYTAYSPNPFEVCGPLHARLFRVGLDGSDQRMLTWEEAHHSVDFSPDGRYFIATEESIDQAPKTALFDADGNIIDILATSDLSRFHELKVSMPEPFRFRADDGETDIYGVLYKPSHFNPNKKYPLVIDVYGGPLSQSVRARFTPAYTACEYGFLVAKIDNRGTTNRGKAFETATYMKLGEVDLKDQADAVRYLSQRKYVDSKRVGILGHSYGGYMAALALLKYPDVFHVACAGGTVTDWRNYDTIYTERFMRTPQENPEGYDAGSCLKYVSNLKGKLLLLHGMVDDNVHTNNMWQLVDSLHKADKPFEMMLFPEAGHSLGAKANAARWEFMRRHLIDDPPAKN
jgi:dipeptidyl-peptidase-4